MESGAVHLPGKMTQDELHPPFGQNVSSYRPRSIFKTYVALGEDATLSDGQRFKGSWLLEPKL